MTFLFLERSSLVLCTSPWCLLFAFESESLLVLRCVMKKPEDSWVFEEGGTVWYPIKTGIALSCFCSAAFLSNCSFPATFLGPAIRSIFGYNQKQGHFTDGYSLLLHHSLRWRKTNMSKWSWVCQFTSHEFLSKSRKEKKGNKKKEAKRDQRGMKTIQERK